VPTVAEAARGAVADSTPRWVITCWLCVIFVGGLVSFYAGPLPFSPADLVLRLLPLAAASTAFALTGRKAFFVLTVVFLALSVLLTLAFATFGSLIALALLLVPALGLVVIGRGIAEAARPRS
jgi:hypothetical protein